MLIHLIGPDVRTKGFFSILKKNEFQVHNMNHVANTLK